MSVTPTAYEQYLLELVNWARANPTGQANLLGISLNENLAPGTISPSAKAPLAFNGLLIDASRQHSDWMLANNTFSHTGIGGSSARDRIEASGYQPGWSGENIAMTRYVGTGHLERDVTSLHEGLFESAGHRTNLLHEEFTEIGIGVRTGKFTIHGLDYDATMITQKFGQSSSGPFLTGVVYDDLYQNGFYTVGEGLGGAVITAQGTGGVFETATWDSGGYTLELQPGTYTVTVSYGGRSLETNVNIGTSNIKLDAIWADMQVAAPEVVEGAIYRFFNEETGVHFLTTSSDERDTIISTMPTFKYEGVAFTTGADASDGLAIYRFYNTETGAHFYTASESERDTVLTELPWFNFEGIAFYAYEEDAADRQGVFRFYNTETDTHFYTASQSERDAVLADLPSFNYEGVAYYVDIA